MLNLNFILNILLYINIVTCYQPILLLNNNNNNNINKNIQKRNILRKEFINFVNYGALFYSIDKFNNYYENNENKNIKIYNNIIKSVCIINTIININNTNITKVGTGVVWTKNGYIITNYHVIQDTIKIKISLENEEYEPKIIGYDTKSDIAVIKINNNNTKPIKLGNIKSIKIGQNAYALGNPYGQNYTFTKGIISGKDREIVLPLGNKISGVIQTDVSINPGNSGGPLLDSYGNLIGINTASLIISSGINFALPIDQVSNTVNKIINYGIIEHAIIGITYLIELPTLYEAQELKIPYIEKGVIILNVPNNSIPYYAGLKGITIINSPEKKIILGDIIIGIDEYKIDNSLDLVTTLKNYKYKIKSI